MIIQHFSSIMIPGDPSRNQKNIKIIWFQVTLSETTIAPEKGPSQKETIVFQTVRFREGNWWLWKVKPSTTIDSWKCFSKYMSLVVLKGQSLRAFPNSEFTFLPPEPWSKGEAFHPSIQNNIQANSWSLSPFQGWLESQTKYHYDVDRITF